MGGAQPACRPVDWILARAFFTGSARTVAC
ncbi:hypothetical protein JOF35_004283 [Streptomyces demainii]|uniref:Uncharacterized protein n=1 Tax=Streptomyces demainii TaxID=588122 RepID=A0ABT9KX96_9ACTN|nr:hypothetical protein [Streptomyces demainii]